jgi:hypothetical protein
MEEIREKQKSSWNTVKMKTIYQKLCHTAKVGLRGKFIAMNAYIKNTEKSQINDLLLLLKLLEKQEQAKPKIEDRDNKNKDQIHDVESKKSYK